MERCGRWSKATWEGGTCLLQDQQVPLLLRQLNVVIGDIADMGISKVAGHPLWGLFEHLHIARGHIQKFLARPGCEDGMYVVIPAESAGRIRPPTQSFHDWHLDICQIPQTDRPTQTPAECASLSGENIARGFSLRIARSRQRAIRPLFFQPIP